MAKLKRNLQEKTMSSNYTSLLTIGLSFFAMGKVLFEKSTCRLVESLYLCSRIARSAQLCADLLGKCLS
jgi:hypothetical protein